MYHDKPRKSRKKQAVQAVALLFSALCFAFAAWRFYGFIYENIRQQAINSIYQTVQNAAVQCYAVEGVYPQSIQELEKSYGLRINRDKFIVSYEVFASNIMPEINVFAKK